MPNSSVKSAALPSTDVKPVRRDVVSPRGHAELPVTRETFDQVMVPCFAPAPFIPVRGEGSRIWDQAGRMYIDFASGVAVTSLGHAHPAMMRALEEPAREIWPVSHWFTRTAGGRRGTRSVRGE